MIKVALDLPAFRQFMNTDSDEFTQCVLVDINSMMLNMLAAVTRKDYEDRRRRQSEGIAKAKLLWCSLHNSKQLVKSRV